MSDKLPLKKLTSLSFLIEKLKKFSAGFPNG